MPVSEPIIRAFCNNIEYPLVASTKHTGCFFGGPIEWKVKGIPKSSTKLHQIARLHCSQLDILGCINDFPLVYGMRFSGCQIAYRFTSREITIDSISPRVASKDWPYEDYPALLPFVPLRVAKKQKMNWKRFSDRFWNLPERQPAELVVVVPPPATAGVSVWGSSGDAEEVSIVFECDLSSQKVKAYNVCS